MFLVVVDELLQAAGDQFVQRNLGGDEGCQIKLALLGQLIVLDFSLLMMLGRLNGGEAA